MAAVLDPLQVREVPPDAQLVVALPPEHEEGDGPEREAEAERVPEPAMTRPLQSMPRLV